MDKKNTMLLTVIAVATLLVAVVGATFAYFSVTGGNTSTSTTVTGSVGGDTVGTLTLEGGGSHLYLAVSASDMAEQKDAEGNTVSKTYYSVSTAGTRAETLEAAAKTTYTAKLTGATTDEITYTCEYEFAVTVSDDSTMDDAQHASDVKLVVTGDVEATQALGSTANLKGTWTGIKSTNPERSFDAYLTLTNTDQPQNSLAGTQLELTISNVTFNCYPE